MNILRFFVGALLLCLLFALNGSVALAGSSWYLIQPQIRSYFNTYYKVGTNDPFSQWVTFKVFDTAAECSKELASEYTVADYGSHSKAQEFNSEPMRSVVEAAANAQCIASNDPRLVPRNQHWYMMSPPIEPRTNKPLEVPLSNWFQSKPYDAPSQCELAITVGLDKARNGKQSPDVLVELKHSECVADNDPRLN